MTGRQRTCRASRDGRIDRRAGPDRAHRFAAGRRVLGPPVAGADGEDRIRGEGTKQAESWREDGRAEATGWAGPELLQLRL